MRVFVNLDPRTFYEKYGIMKLRQMDGIVMTLERCQSRAHNHSALC
jgi:hypothetical protein